MFAAFDQGNEPGQAFVEHGGLQPVDDRLAGLARRNQARAPQQSQVVGDRRFAQRELCGDLTRRQVALAEQIEDAPPGGVVERAEEAVHGTF